METLASPARLEILGYLVSRGPCSVAELAESMEWPADGLYRHLRLLVKAGLAVERGTRPTHRRREILLDAAADHFRIDYDPVSGRRGPEFRRLFAAMQRGLALSLGRLEGHPGLPPSQIGKLLYLRQETGRLTPAALARVRKALKFIETALKRGRSKREGRLFTVTMAMVPILRRRRSR